MTVGARVRRAIVPGSDVSDARWFPHDAIPWRRIGLASIRRARPDFLRPR